MDTNTLRQLTERAAQTVPAARVWPNGLGFDAYGWTYAFCERTRQWFAGRGTRSGRGLTPQDARLRAARDRAYIVDGRKACPKCQTPSDLIADAAHAEAPQDVWECPNCGHQF